MKNIYTFLLLFLASMATLLSQTPPWNNPLRIATSSDGITFSTPTIFQDSAGVPSVVAWKGDTLVCVFQGFKAPIGSSTWDRVSVKFSYDKGITWTASQPIVMQNFPTAYQRPFDPTLVVLNQDSLRLYYSSSNGIPTFGADSIINTYSAISTDGIHYTFEANPRVDEPISKVIDPAVIYYNNSYHYLAPAGSPAQGAFHYVSGDGLDFSKVLDIGSDNQHNWTGNYMVNSPAELRFYGCGSNTIWYNSSSNGGVWNGYVPTNIIGGDPSVVKTDSQQYIMIYVGPPNATITNPQVSNPSLIKLIPNPTQEYLILEYIEEYSNKCYEIYSAQGTLCFEGILSIGSHKVNIQSLPSGMYYLSIKGIKSERISFIKL
ncbi:MAG: T9SS C-terminal target domain-containing protein [Sphingobacteriia bacterium]|nr:T9SS C-terminal target domain-containing protein [Sphingobacteriia bacterium]